MNFPNFPLYASLKKDEYKELTETEKDELTDLIKAMNEDRHSTVYALIRSYHLDHDVTIQVLPYSGKQLKTGPKFDIDCFPSQLQNILYQFATIS